MARRIRATTKALAYQILAACNGHLRKPFTVRVRDGCASVTVAVAPPGVTPGAPPAGVSGRFLSPIEAAVVNALAAAAPSTLNGKQLAAKCSQTYGTDFKVILRNLEERDVLSHEHGEGYRLKSDRPSTSSAD